MADIEALRLEAATSRLEDMATSVDPTARSDATTPTPANISAAVPQTAPAAPAAPPPPPAPVAEPLPATIEDFDKIIDSEVNKFVQAGEKIGGLVEEQVCGPPRKLRS